MNNSDVIEELFAKFIVSYHPDILCIKLLLKTVLKKVLQTFVINKASNKNSNNNIIYKLV